MDDGVVVGVLFDGAKDDSLLLDPPPDRPAPPNGWSGNYKSELIAASPLKGLCCDTAARNHMRSTKERRGTGWKDNVEKRTAIT